MSINNQSWYLDDVAGWRGETSQLSVTGTERELMVDSLPGIANELPDVIQDGVTCPGPMAAAPCSGELYIIDMTGLRIKAATLLHQSRVRTLPGIGGEGTATRYFRRPRGIAVLSDDRIAVADSGNRRVQIFTPFPHALTAVREGFAQPWGVAASACGGLYVSDPGNHVVVEMDANGRIKRSIGGFLRPGAIAVSGDQKLAVADGTTLAVVLAGETKAAWTYTVPKLTSVVFDNENNLYAGTSEGLVYKFVPDTREPLRYAGAGVSGREGGISQLTYIAGYGLVAVITDATMRPILCRIATDASYAGHGQFLSEALDSLTEGCSWHRIQIRGNAPEGTSIRVGAQTSPNADAWPAGTPFVAGGASIVLTGSNPECLFHCPPGRYLRFRLEFVTNGLASPAVGAIEAFYPRSSYLQYLPAVYQEDPDSKAFLDRFLSIFQTSFDNFDRQIDNFWRYFEPAAVPSKWFPWLAAWLALPINPQWTDAQRRKVLKNAFAAYKRRGTPDGLQQLVSDYTGVSVSIVEHFRLRRLTVLSTHNSNVLGSGLRLWSRDFFGRMEIAMYSRLGYFRLAGDPEPGLEPLTWGANRFTVLFSTDPYCVDETLKTVTQIVEREKPAHTEASYCPVFARFRVGVQSTLGIDARIGEISNIVLHKTGKLGYDSILACSRTGQRVRKLGGSVSPRAGISTRLL